MCLSLCVTLLPVNCQYFVNVVVNDLRFEDKDLTLEVKGLRCKDMDKDLWSEEKDKDL